MPSRGVVEKSHVVDAPGTHPALLRCLPARSGEDESEQLQCYMEALGVPNEELLADASRAELFFDPDLNPEVTVNSHGRVHCPGAGKT